MAFLDKLNKVAKNIGDRTGDAIETTKLNSKINQEKAAAEAELKRIGEHYYNVFITTGETAPEALEACTAAKAHFDAVDAAKAEIEKIKAENEAEKTAAQAPSVQSAAPAPVPTQATSAGGFCPECGTANAAGTKFCQGCGHKLEAPAPREKTCPACGIVVAPGVRFCPECGQKLD